MKLVSCVVSGIWCSTATKQLPVKGAYLNLANDYLHTLVQKEKPQYLISVPFTFLNWRKPQESFPFFKTLVTNFMPARLLACFEC